MRWIYPDCRTWDIRVTDGVTKHDDGIRALLTSCGELGVAPAATGDGRPDGHPAPCDDNRGAKRPGLGGVDMSTAEDDKHCDEDRVAGGARWLTAAIVTIGVFNYGYALIMMRLLKVHDYSTFTAGQGLLLWIFALATGAIPLVLAKALSRARSEAERSTATRYAMIVSGGMGFLAALVVTAIALRFAHWAVALTSGSARLSFARLRPLPGGSWEMNGLGLSQPCR